MANESLWRSPRLYGRMIHKCKLVVTPLCLLAIVSAVWLKAQSVSQVNETQHKLAIVHVFNQAREQCYSTPECPNLDQLLELFTSDAKRTEINRANEVVRVEGIDALRTDSLRVARTFTGRRLETTAVVSQGRNVTFTQSNWDPGAAGPNYFTHVLRIQDGRIAHWILVAP